MSETGDFWMYLVDDDILSTVMNMDPSLPKATARPAGCRELVDGVTLHLEGKSAEAIALLEQALEGREAGGGPVVQDLLTTLGQIQFEAKRSEEAASTFRKLLEQDQAHLTAPYNLGVCLERCGNFREALEAFRTASQRVPLQPEARLGEAICHLHLDQFEEALEAFDSFLAGQDGHELAIFGRAVALQRLRRYDEAVDAYGQLAARRPGMPELHNNMIALGLATDDFGLVQEHSERLLALRRHSRPALEGMLASALARADWEEAARYSGDLLKTAPDSYQGWFNRGLAMQKLGRLEEAAEAYLRASELRPADAGAYTNRAAILADLGDEEGARRCFDLAVALGPEEPQLQWNLAVVALRLGVMQAAEELIESVTVQWPEMEEAWFQLGFVRLERQRWSEAAGAFEQALARRPDSPDAKLNLGIALWRAGDGPRATAVLEELVGQSDFHLPALTGLCALAVEAGDGHAARHWHGLLLEAGEVVPELNYNVARLLQLDGQHREAAVLYRSAIEQSPDMVEALLNLGAALQALGEDQEASDCWERSAELDPVFTREHLTA